MKKIYIIFIAAILSCALSGCFGGSEQQTVRIAVMGNEDVFYPGYKEGIKRAERDLNKEYADSGYNVECEFYNDDGSYEEGSALDNSDLMSGDKELQKTMNGFIITNEFVLRDPTNDEHDLIIEMMDEYAENTGNRLDTWYIQGYNAVRNIADTAIKNKTLNPLKISEILHKDGYNGFVENFSFDSKGRQKTRLYKYNIIDESGYAKEHIIK